MIDTEVLSRPARPHGKHVKGVCGSTKQFAEGLCSCCGQHPRHVTRSGKVHSWCRECVNAKSRDYSSRHREQTRKAGRENARTRKYGLNPQEQQAFLEAQGSKCPICGVGLSLAPHSRPISHFDHDHVAKMFRSILCHNCNKMIGACKESKVILQAAIGYLDRFAWMREQTIDGER